MIIQPIVDIPEIGHKHGIQYAVVSPGSRNAPVVLALARHRAIQCFVVPDERSAGYIALGIAQSTGNPVFLTCTSGTATLNLSPAIAEAFYQQVPLIVLTADRPPEWIDQNDNQAIRQNDLYKNHVLYSNTLPVLDNHNDSLRHCHRILSEAISIAKRKPSGPVHINLPIREPFYPEPDEEFLFNADVAAIQDTHIDRVIPEATWQKLEKTINAKAKILLIAGQAEPDPGLGQIVEETSALWKIPVLTEHIANLPSSSGFVYRHDEILSAATSVDLLPDLVISFGRSILSKTLKTVLRRHSGFDHWHIGHEMPTPDPFSALSRVLPVHPMQFFQSMASSENATRNSSFYDVWTSRNAALENAISQVFPAEPFGEFEAVRMVLETLPGNACLHLANSLPTRYAQVLSSCIPGSVHVYANRGTSGIDGCSSTMVGHALVDGALHVLLSGDMAFFYDRNAFWHNHLSANIRVVVLNNGGGGIFRMIPGPDRQPELETYMETKQKQHAANTAADFGFTYYPCSERQSLGPILRDFFSEADKPKLLEIFSDGKTNRKIWDTLRSYIKNNTP